MKSIKVLGVCATSLVTSTMAAVKLEEEFKRRKVPTKVSKGLRTIMSLDIANVLVSSYATSSRAISPAAAASGP